MPESGTSFSGLTPLPPRVSMITHAIFQVPVSGDPVTNTIPANYNLYIGTEVPAPDVGVPGDWYLLLGSGNFYRKLSTTSWTLESTVAPITGTSGVNFVQGTANEVAVSPTFGTPVVSLPAAITLTGKTITGGTFSGVSLTTSTATTETYGTNSTALATTAFVQAALTGYSVDAGDLTGVTLAANVTASSLLSAAGGTFGTAAFADSVDFEPALGNPSSSGYVLTSTTGGVRSWTAAGAGSGTVTTVSVATANGVSGSVATASTTPAITLVLGDITPNSVTAVGSVTGSNLSGTNTGDQTSVTGNAGTATALQTARTINGTAFDGTGNITVTAAAGTLTGTTLSATVTASSLVSAAGGAFGTAAFTAASAYEPALGNPGTSGYVLSSTTGGVRSWIAPGGSTDGWIDPNETWTYASATTFTISGDKTSVYSKGDKLKLTQTTVKYFYVVGVSFGGSDTTITITGGSDYTLANASITLNKYSKSVTPNGFPVWFNYTPSSFGGFSVNPSGAAYRFKIEGLLLTLKGRQTVDGTSNGTNFTMTAPVLSATVTNLVWAGLASIIDNGSALAASGRTNIASNTTTIDFFRDNLATAFTTSGGKRSTVFELSYEI